MGWSFLQRQSIGRWPSIFPTLCRGVVCGRLGRRFFIHGGAANSLDGGSGSDTLVGGGIDNFIAGGAGADHLGRRRRQRHRVLVLVDQCRGDRSTNGFASGGAEIGTDTLTSIENATGGAGDDYLFGDSRRQRAERRRRQRCHLWRRRRRHHQHRRRPANYVEAGLRRRHRHRRHRHRRRLRRRRQRHAQRRRRQRHPVRRDRRRHAESAATASICCTSTAPTASASRAARMPTISWSPTPSAASTSRPTTSRTGSATPTATRSTPPAPATLVYMRGADGDDTLTGGTGGD